MRYVALVCWLCTNCDFRCCSPKRELFTEANRTVLSMSSRRCIYWFFHREKQKVSRFVVDILVNARFGLHVISVLKELCVRETTTIRVGNKIKRGFLPVISRFLNYCRKWGILRRQQISHFQPGDDDCCLLLEKSRFLAKRGL